MSCFRCISIVSIPQGTIKRLLIHWVSVEEKSVSIPQGTIKSLPKMEGEMLDMNALQITNIQI